MHGARRWAPVAAAAWLLACARAPPAESSEPTPGAAPAPPPAPPPVDHLSPGELVEGTASVFGLTLPRDLHVESTFAQVVYANAEVAVHPLAKYFRVRVQGGALVEDDSSATFTHVRIPATADREFYIHIGKAPRGARVEIRDSTPPPAPTLPDEAARWRNVGLTPQGRTLPPVHVN
jgi:hypothetical protein